jgi:hypothetical protein
MKRDRRNVGELWVESWINSQLGEIGKETWWQNAHHRTRKTQALRGSYKSNQRFVRKGNECMLAYRHKSCLALVEDAHSHSTENENA